VSTNVRQSKTPESSTVLCWCLTSPDRTSQASALHLPCADHQEGQSGDLPVPVQGVYAHAKALRPRRAREALAVACSSMLPSTRPQALALWTHSFRGAIPRLRAPLPTSRLSPHGDLRTARGRCGSLDLHRRGLPPPTPCQSPGKSGRCVTAAGSTSCTSLTDAFPLRTTRHSTRANMPGCVTASAPASSADA
jgi:hypothetical protein